jgi:hypothetical protein
MAAVHSKAALGFSKHGRLARPSSTLLAACLSRIAATSYSPTFSRKAHTMQL